MFVWSVCGLCAVCGLFRHLCLFHRFPSAKIINGIGSFLLFPPIKDDKGTYLGKNRGCVGKIAKIHEYICNYPYFFVFLPIVRKCRNEQR